MSREGVREREIREKQKVRERMYAENVRERKKEVG